MGTFRGSPAVGGWLGVALAGSFVDLMVAGSWARDAGSIAFATAALLK